jgi:hypothetical protein
MLAIYAIFSVLSAAHVFLYTLCAVVLENIAYLAQPSEIIAGFKN